MIKIIIFANAHFAGLHWPYAFEKDESHCLSPEKAQIKDTKRGQPMRWAIPACRNLSLKNILNMVQSRSENLEAWPFLCQVLFQKLKEPTLNDS